MGLWSVLGAPHTTPSGRQPPGDTQSRGLFPRRAGSRGTARGLHPARSERQCHVCRNAAPGLPLRPSPQLASPARPPPHTHTHSQPQPQQCRPRSAPSAQSLPSRPPASVPPLSRLIAEMASLISWARALSTLHAVASSGCACWGLQRSAQPLARGCTDPSGGLAFSEELRAHRCSLGCHTSS